MFRWFLCLTIKLYSLISKESYFMGIFSIPFLLVCLQQYSIKCLSLKRTKSKDVLGIKWVFAFTMKNWRESLASELNGSEREKKIQLLTIDSFSNCERMNSMNVWRCLHKSIHIMYINDWSWFICVYYHFDSNK